MTCEKLINGQDSTCQSYARKYYQQLVLINKEDVDSYVIKLPQTSIEGDYTCRYRLSFKLKEGKSGIRFTSSETANIVNGSFGKSVKESIPKYRHAIQFPLFGIDEETKCILDQLDNSEYFGVLQYYDNTIEVFGFENGLVTEDYDYNPSSNAGGNIMLIASESDSLEDFMPFVYFNTDGTEVAEFDNNFQDIEDLPSGDFNDDFSNDFYI